MKTRMVSVLFLITLILGISESSAQQVRQDVGTKLLIPSSARTSAFTSFLAVINLDNQTNLVTIVARRTDGSEIGRINTNIPVGGRFRTTDILGAMGAGLGEFGPITVESTNGRVLSAVSEVSSVQGPGGFFPGVNVATAWMQGFITEVIDTGESGTPGTFRTNLGVNTVEGTPANVTVAFFDDAGNQLGSTTVAIAGNGLTQARVRDLIGAATGRNGYLKFTSNQPIHAWANKIENGTGDPSFQVGIGAAASTPMSQIEPASVDIRNNLFFIALGLLVPIAVFWLQSRKTPNRVYIPA